MKPSSFITSKLGKICTIINKKNIYFYYREGFPKSDLEIFIGNTNCEEVSSGIFRSSSCESLGGLIKDLCCCCPRIHKTYKTLTQRNTSTSNIDALRSSIY